MTRHKSVLSCQSSVCHSRLMIFVCRIYYRSDSSIGSVKKHKDRACSVVNNVNNVH